MGVSAIGSTVTIGGNVTVTGGNSTGAYAYNNSEITIDGHFSVVDTTRYIWIGGQYMRPGQGVSSVTKPGYLEYNVGNNYVWLRDYTPVSAKMPIITTQPQSTAVCTANTTHNLTVAATSPDGGVLTYQWYRNTTPSTTGGTLLNGATATTFAAPVNVVGTYYYYVIVTNTIADNGDGGNKTATATSNIAALTVNPNPIIDLGEDIVLTMNDSVTLSVEPVYQSYLWSTGETTPQITVTRETLSSDSAMVWVVVTTIEGCIGSDTIQISFTVGINTYNPTENLILYPNPSTGKFYLEFDKPENRDITITDLLGRTVFKGSFTEQKVELDMYHAGTYIVDINSAIRKKLIILK
jgi:hypothetical protein